jgi:hypothetical protein
MAVHAVGGDRMRRGQLNIRIVSDGPDRRVG